jgi:hypothetical protein
MLRQVILSVIIGIGVAVVGILGYAVVLMPFVQYGDSYAWIGMPISVITSVAIGYISGRMVYAFTGATMIPLKIFIATPALYIYIAFIIYAIWQDTWMSNTQGQWKFIKWYGINNCLPSFMFTGVGLWHAHFRSKRTRGRRTGCH